MSEPPAPDQEPGKATRDASAAPAPAATRESARRFVAAASHDLRQPLQTLRLLNGSLHDEASAPQLREIVAQQARTIEEMGRLVDALLDIGRLDAGMVEPRPRDVDLAELLAGLGREFAPLARDGEVALHVDAPRIGARTDPVLLGQVLRNLLGNALKFAPRGEVRVSCVVAGDAVVVEVGDDGDGIAPEHLGRIFDEFYRAVPADGDGARAHELGLAIVRRLVDLLGIALSVDSTQGADMRFRLSMPRAALPVADGEAGRRRRRVPAFAVAHRVLLLEDDPGLRQASRRWLAADGFAPGLVVCDLYLADGENGGDALQRLRAAAGRALPALLLSGDSSDAARSLARVEGVRMLLKPVDPDELLAELRLLLEGPRP